MRGVTSAQKFRREKGQNKTIEGGVGERGKEVKDKEERGVHDLWL